MKLLRVAVSLSAFLAFASTASAQTSADMPRGNVSGFGAFALATPDGLDKGHGAGVSGAYFFSDNLGVQGGFTFQSFDVVGTSGNALSGGELTANVLTVNLVGRFGGSSMQPYVSGGVAYYVNDYAIDAATAAALSQFNFTAAESVENAVGFNVGGGVDFIASDRIGFFVEGRYTIAKADTAGGLTDQATSITATTAGEQELNVFTVNGGIRILF